MRTGHRLAALAGFVAVSLAAGAIGSLATAQAIPTWYPTLAKPAWNPPSWVFGPVWTTLYVLMGAAAWLVWQRSRGLREVRVPMALFALQLVLNAAWSLIFFGLHALGAAFVEILLLWLAILATLLSFWRVRPLAGALLLPYLGWVSFASGLTYAVWRLNPT